MNLAIIFSVVRHLLTTIGGALTGAAVVSPTTDVTSPEAVAGAILTIVGFILSIIKTKKVSK